MKKLLFSLSLTLLIFTSFSTTSSYAASNNTKDTTSNTASAPSLTDPVWP